MPFDELPIEHIQHILNALWSSGDTQAIKSCALASRHFLPICRSLQFSSICITTTFDIQPIQNLAHILTDPQAQLPSYVRSFTLRDLARSKMVDRHLVEADNPWTTIKPGEDLATVLSTLTHLRCLRLECNNVTRPRSWSEFPNTMRQAMASLFRLPSLDTVDLVRILDMPPSLFSSTAIKDLALHACGFQEMYWKEWEANPPVPTLLEKLKLGNDVGSKILLDDVIKFILHQLSPLRVSSLKNLHIGFSDGRTCPSVDDLISACQQSLQVLRFHIIEFLSKVDRPFALNGLSFEDLRHLQTIHIGIVVMPSKERNATIAEELFPISTLASLLSSLPATKFHDRLASISLGLYNSFQFLQSTEEDWKYLDQVLASLVSANPGVGLIRVHYKDDTNVELLIHNLRESNQTGRLEFQVGFNNWENQKYKLLA